jgi:transposase-like protein
MDERLQFILDAQTDRFTMAELCARYGVSRRIGYKWLARYAEEGKRGLADRGLWSIYFNTILLATLDERDYIIRG